MKIRILKRHFDAAVKQEWSSRSCLLSQAGADIDQSSFNSNWPSIGTQIAQRSSSADDLMQKFDKYFREPGDEKKKHMQKLRSLLPVTVELL